MSSIDSTHGLARRKLSTLLSPRAGGIDVAGVTRPPPVLSLMVSRIEVYFTSSHAELSWRVQRGVPVAAFGRSIHFAVSP